MTSMLHSPRVFVPRGSVCSADFYPATAGSTRTIILIRTPVSRSRQTNDSTPSRQTNDRKHACFNSPFHSSAAQLANRSCKYSMQQSCWLKLTRVVNLLADKLTAVKKASDFWTSLLQEVLHEVGERRETMAELLFCAILLTASLSCLAADAAEEIKNLRVSGLTADVAEYVRANARPDILMDEFEQVKAENSADQVHVSMAGPNRMKVSWVTRDFSAPTVVEYGSEPGIYTAEAWGESLSYKYIGYKSGLIHHVVLGSDIPLENDTVYYYRCGGTGPDFSFKTPPPLGPDTPIKLNIVGDLGQTGWSVSTLAHMQQSPHDMVILVGDLSYADRYQPRWDTWGRLIEPLASTRPWMVVEGNHEIENVWGLEPSFKAYNARWPMPHEESGSSSNLYYSFEAANVHFIMLGSYADYSKDSEQYRWLQADLAKVDRSQTPWLIAVQHAPWYNSNYAHQGEADGMMEAMEDLLFEAKVDMLFSGHVHAYERGTRAYKGAPHPCGVIHVTIGDGGNREGLATRYMDPPPEWSVVREASFGHGQLEIVNGTTAKWSWHRNQDDISVVADQVWIHTLGDSNHSCAKPEDPLSSSQAQ